MTVINVIRSGQRVVARRSDSRVVRVRGGAGDYPTNAQLAASGGAARIGNDPSGSIAASNVQAAINELAADMAALAGAAFTGAISAPSIAVNGTGGAGFITFAGQASNPTPPSAGAILLHASTANGFTRLEQDNESATNLFLGRDLCLIAKNASGSTITKGSVVYVNGSSGGVPTIAKARADSSTTLPAMFMVVDSIANNAFGQVMRSGILTGFDTSAFSVGAKLFLSTSTAGALTVGRPSGANYVQRIGVVLVSGVGNGSMDVNILPGMLNMETGTNAATWTGNTVVATTLRVATATPASASAAGTAGTIAWDANYIYVCTATNTWKRTAIATW